MRAFGVTADGRPIHAATLTWPGGLEVQILDYGAIVHRLGFPAAEGLRQGIIGRDTLGDYERDTAYVGALVGRCANRIGGGRFRLDGRDFQLSVNEPPNTLHGGAIGFNKRAWRFTDVAGDGRSLALVYRSADGEEGFPGTAEVRAIFTLIDADTLQIEYEAVADAPTPLNLSHHIYFNLLGDRATGILDHTLAIAADGFTPVDQGQIPTGEIASVTGTPFDLRSGERIGAVLNHTDPQLTIGGGLDLNWALDASAETALTLTSPDGATLSISTDQPGIQVYSGQKLQPPFIAHGALAIEPQGFPDAVNQASFPDVILRPGDVYRRRSRYRFRG